MYSLNYNVLTFILIFYIYGFLGWCFESAYVSIKSKKWVNRGFVKGPVLPVYGSGAVAILFVTLPVMSSPFLVFLLSVLSATVLELATGIVMESLFKVKYWDYSKNFMNYKGYICLKSSITWGFMGLLVTYVINEPIAEFINSASMVLIGGADILLSIAFACDFVIAFRQAYSLRELILSNERLMKELNELKVNIAVAISEADYRKNSILAEIREKVETAFSYTEIDDYIIEKYNELKKLDIAEYIDEWKEKAKLLRQRIENLDFTKASILRRNPTATSRRGFVNEIKEFARNKKL